MWQKFQRFSSTIWFNSKFYWKYQLGNFPNDILCIVEIYERTSFVIFWRDILKIHSSNNYMYVHGTNPFSWTNDHSFIDFEFDAAPSKLWITHRLSNRISRTRCTITFIFLYLLICCNNTSNSVIESLIRDN